MFNIDPALFADTRDQLHWASQLLSAAADATLEKAADDSHSNLGWHSDESTLVNRGDVGIDVKNFEIFIAGSDSNRLDMRGKSLDEVQKWLAGQLSAELNLRDYEMPSHAVQSDGLFSPVQQHLEEISRWFALASRVCDPIAPSRIWPHHFDLGWLIEIEGPQRSIGGGFSLGDKHFDQPYFYLNPYGVEKPNELPELPSGGVWNDSWFGAVLTANELLKSTDAESSTNEFFDVGIRYCRTLF